MPAAIVGLRDRPLIGVIYAFARIGAVVSMRVEDYFSNGKRVDGWSRFENGNRCRARSQPVFGCRAGR
jgi:hypothetical protein